ncbi:MAG TPA: hypothetical protein DCX60_01790 [Phycisphaerales bacterium]|nr:hypothetical protein [Phycisphaerales bacterium]
MCFLAEFSGGGGGGMALGLLIMPMSIAALLLRRPSGPIRKLVEAGAVSEETARKPRSVDIPREIALRPYERFGVVRRLSDGRCWVDRRRERLIRGFIWGSVTVVAASLALISYLVLTTPKEAIG